MTGLNLLEEKIILNNKIMSILSKRLEKNDKLRLY